MDKLPDVARVVRRIHPKLHRGAWLLFALAVVVNLWGLATLAELFPPEPVKWALLGALPVLLIASAYSTFKASTGFAQRRDAIVSFLWGSVALDTFVLSYVDQHGRLSFRGSRDEDQMDSNAASLNIFENDEPWQIAAAGAYLPARYNMPHRLSCVTLPWPEYVGMLDAEVHRARTDAAKLAGAFAGAFVVSIQVYARLLPLLAS